MSEDMLSEETSDYFIEEMVLKLIKEGVDHREIMVTVAPPSLDLGGAVTIASVDCGDGSIKRYLRVKFLENRREQGRLWLKHGYMPSGVSFFLWEKCRALLLCFILCFVFIFLFLFLSYEHICLLVSLIKSRNLSHLSPLFNFSSSCV